jgi:hypothetical protein
VSIGGARVELRYWSFDGSCYEAVFGDTVSVDIVQGLEAEDEPNERGWRMAKEPFVPLGPQRAEITGIERVTRHAPGYLTPEQRRIRELEADVAWLRLVISEMESA